jgi:hypothetical protein
MKPSVTILHYAAYSTIPSHWIIRINYPRLSWVEESFESEEAAVNYCKKRKWFIETISR